MTVDSRMQERVFAYLTDPAAHPLIHRIDTHAASVFLEGDSALKIKRAVVFPYLDYSTLQKRKAACDEEMRINRQFAPQLYRRVVPITQSKDGALDIGGDGTPVEYAIEMTRFDERQTFDHLAKAGLPDPALVDAVADTIAASHLNAPLAPAEPWIASIPAFIEEAIPKRFEPPPALRKAPWMTSGMHLCPHFRGFANRWSGAARTDTYGVATAICIWPTLC